MKRLILSILWGVITISAFATPNFGKIHQEVLFPMTAQKSPVKATDCTVTLNLSQSQSFFCEMTQTTSSTVICVTATATASTCATAEHNAHLIADPQMLDQTVKWFIDQELICDSSSPVE